MYSIYESMDIKLSNNKIQSNFWTNAIGGTSCIQVAFIDKF